MRDYDIIVDIFERNVYVDTYKRLHSHFRTEKYFMDFPFNSMEEARIILRHASKFNNNKFIGDGLKYIERDLYCYGEIKEDSEKYWSDISTEYLFINEEREYRRQQKEIEDNKNIPVNCDDLGEADILKVSVSYVAYDDYPGIYRHITVGRIHRKDLDKIKDYIIKKYVSYNHSSGGYNYHITVIPYVSPELLKL